MNSIATHVGRNKALRSYGRALLNRMPNLTSQTIPGVQKQLRAIALLWVGQQNANSG